VASDKLEYGARTIRRKITDKLPEFLTQFPPVIKHEYPAKSKAEVRIPFNGHEKYPIILLFPSSAI
jgi:deoxyribodipyrimidine photo-lyase